MDIPTELLVSACGAVTAAIGTTGGLVAWLVKRQASDTKRFVAAQMASMQVQVDLVQQDNKRLRHENSVLHDELNNERTQHREDMRALREEYTKLSEYINVTYHKALVSIAEAIRSVRGIEKKMKSGEWHPLADIPNRQPPQGDTSSVLPAINEIIGDYPMSEERKKEIETQKIVRGKR